MYIPISCGDQTIKFSIVAEWVVQSSFTAKHAFDLLGHQLSCRVLDTASLVVGTHGRHEALDLAANVRHGSE